MLLDSEGMDAVTGEGRNDNHIFTLTVLLTSVLIYNSQGVPTRSDLRGLEYPFKCSNNNEMFILTLEFLNCNVRLQVSQLSVKKRAS